MKPTSFSYAQSLRAIGELLEAQGISVFELEKQDENCILRMIAVQPAREGSFLKRPNTAESSQLRSRAIRSCGAHAISMLHAVGHCPADK
jgi:hypothetical protein